MRSHLLVPHRPNAIVSEIIEFDNTGSGWPSSCGDGRVGGMGPHLALGRALLDRAQRQIVVRLVRMRSHLLVPHRPNAIVSEIIEHSIAPGAPHLGVNVPLLEKEIFFCAKIEVVHKSLLYLCGAAPITCSYVFEGVIHLVIATIEI